MDRASYRRRHAPSGMMPVTQSTGRTRSAASSRPTPRSTRISSPSNRRNHRTNHRSRRRSFRSSRRAEPRCSTVVLVVRTAVRRLRRFGALAVAVLGRQSPNQHADQANQRANATTIERFASSFMDTTLGAARPTHKRPSDDDPVETILRLRISRRDERWRPAQACNRRIPFP